MNRLIVYLISCSIFLHYSQIAQSQTNTKTFKTKYTTIYYTEDRDIHDFIWRLGGQRLELSADTELASNRVDRIVERVESILDMRPKNFGVTVYLYRGLLPGENKTAFYKHETRSIHVSVDYASDGVVAHEIAHAVIKQYFVTPPPSKIQEILTQYVDKYLWSDY